MREPDHMERQMGYQGNSVNHVQGNMHNMGGSRGNQMHGGGDVNNMGMPGGNINIGDHHRASSSGMDGSNMNMTSGHNMNSRGGVGMNMNSHCTIGNTGLAVSSGMSSISTDM